MRKLFLTALMSLILTSPAGAVPAGDLLEGVRPGPDGMIDVVGVFAHQDDESIWTGGTLVKLKEDPRVRIHLVCLTLGDKSGAMGPLEIDEQRQGEIRTRELQSAATVYQADSLTQLTHHDQGLAGMDREELVAEITALLERAGAEVVITHDPGGVTGHPDHMTCSAAVTEAVKRVPVQRLYYATLPGWIYRMLYHGDVEPRLPEIKVDIRKQKRLKRLACYSHATQKHFSPIGIEMDLALFLNHEYFARGAAQGGRPTPYNS